MKAQLFTKCQAALSHYQLRNLSVERETESQLSQQATGLVADMVLHNKRQEGETGGDFGLIIVHPKIVVKSNSIEVKKGFSSGLLCQAKMKRRDRRWGDLRKQRETLPAHLDYSSLVLYSYLDEERSELNQPVWKPCKGNSLPELELLLKKDDPGETLGTVDVIRRLGRSQIGTSDQAKIDKVISPSVRQHLELRIYWSTGHDPKGPVAIKVRPRQTVDNKVYVRVRRS